LPPGESFEIIVEDDKLEKIKRVIAHNGGEVVGQSRVGEDMRLRVSTRRSSKN
jgi:selenophosphate synthetase-related protein